MTILTRVEALEAALLKPKEDERYKLLLLKNGESREEGIVRSELQDWPSNKIMIITFVSPRNIDS